MRIHDIAVIGAGLAGSSLAKAMADLGWRTVLVDRQTFPRHKVCGEFLSPESQGILDELGLLEAVQELQPRSVEQASLVLRGGTRLDIPLPGAGLGVSRLVLDTALHRAASQAGVEVLTGTTVTSMTPLHGVGVELETRQGGQTRRMQARAVVAAWGTNPRMGSSSLSSSRSMNSRQGAVYVGVKSHFTGTAADPAVELYFVPGGYVGISPVAEGKLNVCALLKQDRLPEEDKDKSILGILMHAGRYSPPLKERLFGAVPVPGTQAAVAPIRLSRRPVPWGDCAHVGDAALMVPPLCGDGMSMALRSALLCAKLADGYLGGRLTLDEWRQMYTLSMKRECSGPLRWGRILHTVGDMPLLSGWLMRTAKWAPQLVQRLVHATRLKDTGR
ncbi:NAD(P)/FAD-dependent oxidoreductase [Paenibacillus rigui]|uniref:Monooxygenase n=1 Tax=Paenibacillus rigui TaxID=554312 RepID=A0A229UVS9_9BACL|nr:NAD(P)/FAD-dependent oxidoreductase [Paenibacillus rigui]OXM87470.1 monooxygenase [Paenibacillus rigui]